MIADDLVKGFYITFKHNVSDSMCTGKLFRLEDPLDAITEFKKQFPEGVFLGMLYKEL